MGEGEGELELAGRVAWVHMHPGAQLTSSRLHATASTAGVSGKGKSAVQLIFLLTRSRDGPVLAGQQGFNGHQPALQLRAGVQQASPQVRNLNQVEQLLLDLCTIVKVARAGCELADQPSDGTCEIIGKPSPQ